MRNRQDIYGMRLEGFRRLLRRRKLDAFLVTHPENRRYLSSYSAADHGIQESSGVLLIPLKGEPLLLTDSRFELQAKEEASGYRVELYARGLLPLLEKILQGMGAKKIGFESHYTLHSTANRMVEKLSVAGMELLPLHGLVEKMRLIKTEFEIEAHRASVLLNEKVFQRVLPRIVPGVTEVEVSLMIESTMRELGADKPCFETIVAFGVNGAKPHAVPGMESLAEGDVVLVDMGLALNGYCSDMSRTFVSGKAEELFLKRLRVVRKAQLAGQEAVCAGALCCDVDKAARKVIEEAGYGDYFAHALGHGVGLNVHEDPRLGSRSRKKLRSGMVITVEPGIYIPGWGGIRLENMLVVRDDGFELLNEDTTWLDA